MYIKIFFFNIVKNFQTESIIEKLRSIERNSTCKPSEKCVIFTKSDLALDKKGGINVKEKGKKLKKELECETYSLSSKTMENFKEVIKYFKIF